ncbi:MAG: universal stress protein [Bacteroidia bacterium]|nr:universal stress protein [Bacteroidia bacterium]NNM23812.1 universal stress protein [Flavobacteriaceae bacterium]
MKRIILPTDFSENAFNAALYATRLFAREKCTFYLLHTYTPSAFYVGYNTLNTYSSLQLEEMVAENAKRGLEEVEARIKQEEQNTNHQFVKIAAFNLLTNEIENLVETHGIDLVVMGTKGATGAKEVFIGTQTVHALKKAKCPILAVPASFHYEAPKEILFATDFKFEQNNPFFPLIKDIAQNNAARINILNAYYGYPLSEEQEGNKDFMDNYFKSASHIFHTAENVAVVVAVEEFQIKHKINFMVMVQNQHTFFENLLFKPVINEIAYHTQVPFLVIPSKDKIQ